MASFGIELSFLKSSLSLHLEQHLLFLLINAWLALDYGLVEAICLLQVEVDVFDHVVAPAYRCLSTVVIPCHIGIELGDCGCAMIGEWPMHCC